MLFQPIRHKGSCSSVLSHVHNVTHTQTCIGILTYLNVNERQEKIVTETLDTAGRQTWYECCLTFDNYDLRAITRYNLSISVSPSINTVI